MNRIIPLKKSEDFRRAYRGRRVKSNRDFVCYISPNGLEEIRLGISVSKKVGNSVVRHRIKRLLRESIRTSDISIKSGYDIVVVVKKEAKDIDYKNTHYSIFKLLTLHKIALKA